MLKKDLIELSLLYLLNLEDLYGYEILRRVREIFPDTQESALYAQLRGLCKEGSTEQYEGTTSDGPTRKYYRITAAGRDKLSDLLTQWRKLRGAMTTLGIE